MYDTDIGLVEPEPVAQQDLVHRLVALAALDRARDHRAIHGGPPSPTL
jgi:hypothetical protein